MSAQNTADAGRTAYTIDLTEAALARTKGIELKDASGWIVAEIRAARDGTFDHAGKLLDTLNAAPDLVKAIEEIEALTRPGQTVSLQQATDIICDVWIKARSTLAIAMGEAIHIDTKTALDNGDSR